MTNGDSETGPNGIAKTRPETDDEKAATTEKADPRDDVIELEEETVAAVEKVKEKAASLISGKIDEDEKDKVWEKNGYAHAPLWPQVRESC